jgi:peptidoglycan/LPS O-acetylase OafA/YrhL
VSGASPRPAATAAASAAAPRLPVVDLLKAVGCQLIVLHHLAFYGPMSDAAWPLAADLFDGLSDYGRWAVQVFLVVGGYLAARSLAPDGRWHPPSPPGRLLAERYLRLALPLAAVLIVAVAASALARSLMIHPSISAPPTAGQVLAHLALLQDLLGVEALSAGLWYVAIDFQLYALLLLVLVTAAALDRRLRRTQPVGWWLVGTGVAVSALAVNRWPAWDIVAPYFFAAYGLGVLAAWAGADRSARPVFGLALGAVGIALAIDWRGRLALAAGVAILLALAAATPPTRPAALAWRGSAVVAWLGSRSYAIFLVHFPVCLVVNALFTRFVPVEPWPQAIGIVVAWAASLFAGAAFHRGVEAPAMRWVSAWRGPAGGARCSGLRAG